MTSTELFRASHICTHLRRHIHSGPRPISLSRVCHQQPTHTLLYRSFWPRTICTKFYSTRSYSRHDRVPTTIRTSSLRPTTISGVLLMKQEKLLKYENAKLKYQMIFSMPAGKDLCGRECKGCYAIKFQKLYPNVLPYRQRRYEASMQPDFVSRIVAEIVACKKPITAIRVHESSDFYSQQYIDSWHSIASALPHFTFYAFTKRLSDFDFTALSSLQTSS